MNEKTLKTLITKYLSQRNMLEKVDDILIDDVVFNMLVAKQCKDGMFNDKTKQFEVLTNITRDEDKEPFYQKNRLYDIYIQSMKSVKDSLIKLGLTPQERTKLKLALSETSDEFGDIFDEKQ